MKNTAKISGVGVVCVHGVGDESLLNSERMLYKSYHDAVPRQSGAVPHFDSSQFITQKKSLKLMSRASLLGIAASKIATKNTPALSEAGLFMSVGMSGGELTNLSGMLSMSITQDDTLDLRLMGEHGLSRINPLLSFHVLNNMPLCHTSIELGIHGPHAALYTANDAGGLRALSRAAQCVVRQEAPLALAGGADSPLDTINLTLSSRQLPAEGAAMMVFSTEGDIEWVGLSEHKEQSPLEALRSLTDESPTIQLKCGEVGLFGDTQAASAALWIARAIALLRVSPVGTMAAVIAIEEDGVSVALLRRCQ